MASRQPLSLKARAVALLAQREHSAMELRRKLLKIARDQAQAGTRATALSGLSRRSAASAEDLDQADWSAADVDLSADEAEPVDLSALGEQVDEVLDWLRANAYLDESRFVESRVHVRSQRWGQRRIEQELSQHGLGLDAAQRAQLAASEFDRALAQLARKFGGADPDALPDPAQEARQMRFLLGRGFGVDLARRAIRAHREVGASSASSAG